jgi:hypothetical protein
VQERPVDREPVYFHILLFPAALYLRAIHSALYSVGGHVVVGHGDHKGAAQGAAQDPSDRCGIYHRQVHIVLLQCSTYCMLPARALTLHSRPYRYRSYPCCIADTPANMALP